MNTKEALSEIIFQKFENQKINEKKLLNLLEKINIIDDEQADELLLKEDFSTWLSLATFQKNKCTKKCKNILVGKHANLLYYKRRMCVHECYVDFYTKKISILKKKGIGGEKLKSAQNELANSKKKYEMYKKSGFLKNSYINVNRDMTLRKLEED